MLDHCHAVQEIPQHLFDLIPASADPKEAKKYKSKKQIKTEIPPEYAAYKRLFEADEFFFGSDDYQAYCELCQSSREELAEAITSVLTDIFHSAVWIK